MGKAGKEHEAGNDGHNNLLGPTLSEGDSWIKKPNRQNLCSYRIYTVWRRERPYKPNT